MALIRGRQHADQGGAPAHQQVLLCHRRVRHKLQAAQLNVQAVRARILQGARFQRSGPIHKAHTCAYTQAHTHTHTPKHTRTHTHTHVHARTHARTHAHTHTHASKYAHTPQPPLHLVGCAVLKNGPAHVRARRLCVLVVAPARPVPPAKETPGVRVLSGGVPAHACTCPPTGPPTHACWSGHRNRTTIL